MNQEQPHQQPVQYVYYVPEPQRGGAVNTLSAAILWIFALIWVFAGLSIGGLLTAIIAAYAAEGSGALGALFFGAFGGISTLLIAIWPPVAILKNI